MKNKNLINLSICFLFFLSCSLIVSAEDFINDKLLADLDNTSFKIRESAHKTIWEKINDDNYLEFYKEALLVYKKPELPPEARVRLRHIISSTYYEYEYHPSGFLGITMEAMKGAFRAIDDFDRIKVVAITPDTAVEGVLEINDEIISVNKQVIMNIGTIDDFIAFISNLKPGSLIEVGVIRKGEKIKLSFKIGNRPEEFRNGISYKKLSFKESFKEFLKNN